jgi:phage terminase small subunit
MARRTSPKLAVVDAPLGRSSPPPPAFLGPVGIDLWNDIVSAYEFGDRAALETLAQACAAADRAERCREQIDRDGELVKTARSVRDHPLIKYEIQARAFLCRTLARLGLDLEPLRDRPGRPPGPAVGVTYRKGGI